MARRLAKEYERMTGLRFPGGVENAYIERTYAGRHQKDAGAWLWLLQPIERYNTRGEDRMSRLRSFGSIAPAREAVHDPDEWIDVGM